MMVSDIIRGISLPTWVIDQSRTKFDGKPGKAFQGRGICDGPLGTPISA